MSSNNILIIGKGLVGNTLRDTFSKLLLDPTKNRFYDKLFFASRSNNVGVDYTDINALNKFCFNNGITHIINCSGFTGRPNVDECETRKQECWYLNTSLPLKISRMCEARDIEYIHISSGCIYTGYEKDFTEEDEPNFGLYNTSSFYSKSKHAYENLTEYGCTIRIRMPITETLIKDSQYVERNFINKILKYDNIISFTNSKSYLPDLGTFISKLISNNLINKYRTINFANPDPLSTKDMTDIMKQYNIVNPNWKFVDIGSLNLAAPRSNCVLDTSLLQSIVKENFTEQERENFLLPESELIHDICKRHVNEYRL